MSRDKTLKGEGQTFIFSAPSGAGKTTLIDALIKSDENLVRSISHTTRPIRNTERDGIDYRFVSVSTFDRMVSKKDFIEYATVFGERYGTAKEELDRQLMEGKDVALDIDWQGARILKNLLPESVSIFILPPSINALRHRLLKRGDNAVLVASRMNSAKDEIEHFEEYDYLIFNSDFEKTLGELRAILIASRLKTAVQKIRRKTEITELIEA